MAQLIKQIYQNNYNSIQKFYYFLNIHTYSHSNLSNYTQLHLFQLESKIILHFIILLM